MHSVCNRDSCIYKAMLLFGDGYTTAACSGWPRRDSHSMELKIIQQCTQAAGSRWQQFRRASTEGRYIAPKRPMTFLYQFIPPKEQPESSTFPGKSLRGIKREFLWQNHALRCQLNYGMTRLSFPTHCFLHIIINKVRELVCGYECRLILKNTTNDTPLGTVMEPPLLFMLWVLQISWLCRQGHQGR